MDLNLILQTRNSVVSHKSNDFNNSLESPAPSLGNTFFRASVKNQDNMPTIDEEGKQNYNPNMYEDLI